MEKVLPGTIKRVALLGPESSGKSTLAAALAQHFDALWVPEFARDYLATTEGQYEYKDLLTIAKGQIETEYSTLQDANQFLFSDTELLTIKIWSDAKYGRCDPWIESQLAQQDYDLYLLCKPDFDWCPDPLRENSDKGDFYFEVYRKMLLDREWPFEVVEGMHEVRLERAIKWALRL